MSAGLWAGVDIGGSKTLALLRENGQTVAESVTPTPADAGGAAVLDTAAKLVQQLLSQHGGKLLGAGVGAAGVIGADGRVLASSDSFTDWVGTPIGDGLSDLLNGISVSVENDAHAFLRGELSVAQAQPENALAVILGTGVGGALQVDGRILRGASDGAGAGEIGHVGHYGDELCSCGQRGHLEAYASGRSLSRRYAAVTGIDLPSAVVAAAAFGGDAQAAAIFEEAGVILGSAIAQAAGLLGLDLAILGGGVLGSWGLMEKSVLQALAEQPLVSGAVVRTQLSQLGGRAVAVGAAELARTR
jgi:glucokinase